MRRVLSIFVFVILAKVSLAQNYIPLLGQLNEWKFTTCYFGCTTVTYYTDGDTLVNGLNYKILDGYHYVSRSFLLHEDVTTKQITLVKFGPGQFNSYLLYDFSLQEGDSMVMSNSISPFPNHDGYFLVDSIRMRLMPDGIQHKTFYFSRTPSNSGPNIHPIWVEGVGSLSLINAPGGQPDINEVGTLSCHFKDNVLTYSNLDSIQGCTAEHFLGVEAVDLTSVEVFPNPSRNSVQISGINSDAVISVFNSNGVQIRIEEEQYTENGCEFSLMNNPAGIYFIQITTTTDTRVLKLEKLN